LNHAGHFYNKGFPLPLRKAVGLGMIRVGPGKFLTVFVKQSHLRVVVFSPLIFSERCGFMILRVQKYIMLIAF